MNRLKNPHKEQRLVDEPEVVKKRSAHLSVQEVDPDDWLEDDLGPSTKKQKIRDEFRHNSPPPTTPSVSQSKKLPSSDSESDDEVVRADAFDVVMNASDRVMAKKNRRNSMTKQRRKSSSQPSLLDAGFVRFIEETPSISPQKSSHNASFNESSSRLKEIEKQIVIKVQVGDEKIIVPLNRDAASELKVSWLSEEASRRYCW